MKKIQATGIALSFAAFAIFAFPTNQTGSLKGTVSPADGATGAWAISKTDTSKSAIYNGMFEIKNLRAGNYALYIEAIPPYKNVRKDDILVTEGSPTDVGDIKLSK